MPPSRVLDVLKSPVKVGLSTRGLVQENLRGHFAVEKMMATSFSHSKLYSLQGFNAAGCLWQVLQTNYEKHNDDVIMTSFHVVGI